MQGTSVYWTRLVFKGSKVLLTNDLMFLKYQPVLTTLKNIDDWFLQDFI